MKPVGGKFGRTPTIEGARIAPPSNVSKRAGAVGKVVGLDAEALKDGDKEI